MDPSNENAPVHIPSPPQWSVPPDIDAPVEDSLPPALATLGRHDDHKRRLGEEEIEDRKAERALRRKYANRAYWFAVVGVLFWASLLVWTGCATYYREKAPFSENILIAITTATSVNLFAAFLGVIRGLFPVKGKVARKRQVRRR